MPSIKLPARSFRFFWKLHTICWFKKILLHSTYNIKNFFLLFCYFRLLHVCLGVLYILQLSKNIVFFITDVKKHVSKRLFVSYLDYFTRRRRTTYIRFFCFLSFLCVCVFLLVHVFLFV